LWGLEQIELQLRVAVIVEHDERHHRNHQLLG